MLRSLEGSELESRKQQSFFLLIDQLIKRKGSLLPANKERPFRVRSGRSKDS